MIDSVGLLPFNLYSSAGVRALDRVAIEEFGIPGSHLMLRAGRAAFRELLRRWPRPEHLHVFCGTGNNGGDGFVIAALARQRGLPVTAWQVGAPEKIRGDALSARQYAEREGVSIEPFAGFVPTAGVVVDALLGTGLKDPVRAPFSEAIQAINASGLPVLAADIPSGLSSDTGQILGCAVAATVTMTFIGLKQGLVTGSGPDVCGALRYADLNVPAEVFDWVAPGAARLDLSALLGSLLPPRPRSAHKGLFGHVLVVGGDHGMAGAAAMASQAALRVGAGLVSCATRAEHVPVLVGRCPEVMAHAVRSGQDLEPLLARASVVVIGPGLGRAAWGQQLLQKALRSGLPLVVDADALNLLAEGVVPFERRERWLLTPHPGEAARLLHCATAEIGHDRFDAVSRLQRQYGGAVVLKGAGTLVADSKGIGVCNEGNPGMASGGMGDVLSGVLGGLIAQRLDVGDAARLGVCLHGRAGDLAAAAGERGMTATDLMPFLRRLVNP